MIDAIVGFFSALLAGLGIGGGGLLVIYLVLYRQAEQLAAQGVNLLFFLFSSGAAMLVHFKKRKIPLVFVGLISAFGVIGAIIGSNVAKIMPAEAVRMVFGALLIVSGTITLFK
ncbi:MAG: hypothetical protein E7635_05135 [Ruminococcaceae bacterium]|nr:hypothetical protein [Oscillospiraceae bacterium]